MHVYLTQPDSLPLAVLFITLIISIKLSALFISVLLTFNKCERRAGDAR